MRVGGDLSEFTAGLRLAVDAARWLSSRKAEPDARFRSMRPKLTELRNALARDAVCAVDALNGLEGWGLDASDLFGETSDPPPLGFIVYERERLVLMDFHGGALFDVRRSQKISDVKRAYAKRERLRSAGLQASAPTAVLLDKLAKLSAEYDELVPARRAERSRAKRKRRRRSRRRAKKRRKRPPRKK
jgi:hypothetical protein